MRLAWLVLMLGLVLPGRIAWGGGAAAGGDCCAEACDCARPASSSCCETPEGPVLVALCGCGEPHAPRSVERVRFDGLALLLQAPEPLPEAWPAAPAPSLVPDGLGPAPEPPPPRPLV